MEFAAAEAGAVHAAGRPLEGIRVLAIEQMQALPYATNCWPVWVRTSSRSNR